MKDSDDPFANAQTEQTTVTVGAVLNDFKGGYWSTAVIITKEQGIQNMGLYANGMDDYRIYLDGEIDTPTEEKLVEQISAIAARSEAAEVVNLLESHRKNQQNKQSLLVVFGAITLVFMAVSVSMIVSSNTRRIQSDDRLIGMLRAVGAEERTILDIYTGQVTVSIVGGFVLTVFAFWFMNVSKIIVRNDDSNVVVSYSKIVLLVGGAEAIRTYSGKMLPFEQWHAVTHGEIGTSADPQAAFLTPICDFRHIESTKSGAHSGTQHPRNLVAYSRSDYNGYRWYTTWFDGPEGRPSSELVKEIDTFQNALFELPEMESLTAMDRLHFFAEHACPQKHHKQQLLEHETVF